MSLLWGCCFLCATLKLLDELSPGHGYYHSNGKSDSMLSLFQWKWASVDHVIPFSKNGRDVEENYVTACWRCNLDLNDKSEEGGKPFPNEVDNDNAKLKWDGLSSVYVKLNKKKDEWVRLLKN
jgi:hypothetical protein